MLLKEFLDFDIYNINTVNIENVCFGNNEKNTLVVVGQNDYSSELQELLIKVFNAIHYDLNNDTVICLLKDSDEVQLSAVLQKYKVEKIIIFGIENTKIHLNILLQNYKPTIWNNITLLKVDPLGKIAQSKQLKGALWQSLKALFKEK